MALSTGVGRAAILSMGGQDMRHSPLVVASRSPYCSPLLQPVDETKMAMSIEDVNFELLEEAVDLDEEGEFRTRLPGDPNMPTAQAAGNVQRDEPAYVVATSPYVVPATPSPFLHSSFAPSALLGGYEGFGGLPPAYVDGNGEGDGYGGELDHSHFMAGMAGMTMPEMYDGSYGYCMPYGWAAMPVEGDGSCGVAFGEGMQDMADIGVAGAFVPAAPVMGNQGPQGYPSRAMAAAAAYVPAAPGKQSNGGSAALANCAPAEGALVSPLSLSSNGTERAGRTLNGLSVLWIGERAFRATVKVKDQIEAFGFLLKVYRNYEKCCRALDKKSSVSSTATFLVSEAYVEPMLAYLCGRDASGLRIVVDASVSDVQAEVRTLVSSLAWPHDSTVVVASCWEEVLIALHSVSDGASMRVASAPFWKNPKLSSQETAQVAEARAVAVRDATEGGGANTPAMSDSPWTIVWVSDQAFKPSAVGQKERLESLGCTVKGYKTHKNAARALDKKRTLARAIFLVSSAEAAPFIAYLGTRPELEAVPVVVEASAQAQAVPARDGPVRWVTNGFEAAVAAVLQILADPGLA